MPPNREFTRKNKISRHLTQFSLKKYFKFELWLSKIMSIGEFVTSKCLSWNRMLRTSTNPKINKLVDRWEVVSSWREGMRRAEEGDYVFVNGKISSQHVITSSPKDK